MLVTLIDANHVPGSVMILVKGYFGNILYTGDFRYCLEMLQVPSLRVLLNREDLDLLYVDNTYLYPTCDFPSRDQVKDKLLTFLCNHPCHKIYIGTYKLGKEQLLVDIALTLKERILVSSDKMKQLEILNLPDVFTTDVNASRIHCVHAPLLHRRFLAKENQNDDVLGVKLTALFHGWDLPESGPFSAGQTYNLHIFEYSDHSSYSELLDFVEAVKPKEVKPLIDSTEASGVIKNWTSFHVQRVNMAAFQPFLSKLPKKFISRPAAAMSMMMSEEDDDVDTRRVKKRRRILHVKERAMYRGPKGPVYESSSLSSTSASPLLGATIDQEDEALLKKFHFTLKELRRQRKEDQDGSIVVKNIFQKKTLITLQNSLDLLNDRL